jgi:hypothetical protein
MFWHSRGKYCLQFRAAELFQMYAKVIRKKKMCVCHIDSLRRFSQLWLQKAQRGDRVVQSQWELRYLKMDLFFSASPVGDMTIIWEVPAVWCLLNSQLQIAWTVFGWVTSEIDSTVSTDVKVSNWKPEESEAVRFLKNVCCLLSYS